MEVHMSIESDQALINAIKAQSLPDVLNALAAGANPNAYIKDVSILGLHDDAVWPTSRKYGDNWLAILDTLLKHGANPNLPADYGTPLLHSLTLHPVLPGIEMLLAAGADPNLIAEGETALDWHSMDASYVETCGVPQEHKARVLPDYPLPSDDEWDSESLNAQLWLLSVHQQAYRILRKAGARFAWEMRQVPVNEVLCLYPDTFGGLHTRYGRPDDAFFTLIGEELTERIRCWAQAYVDPDVAGYHSAEVKAFDYWACLKETFAIGQAIATRLPEAIQIETYQPTRQSIEAGCTHGDAYIWRPATLIWARTSTWRDKFTPLAAQPS
jgi:hypothetical protein